MYFACDRKSESKLYLKFIQMVNAIVITDHHSPKQCQRKDSEGQQILSEYFSLSDKIHGFFLYVTHLLIFSKRVRGEMSFQRGKTIMA